MSKNKILDPTPFRLLRDIISLPPNRFICVFFGSKDLILEHSIFFRRLKTGSSFVRWGDGETAIARGKQIGFQSMNSDLQKKLNNLAQKQIPNLVFGIPWPLTAGIFDKRWNFRLLKIMFSTKIYLLKNLPVLDQVYGQTEFFWNIGNGMKDLLAEIACRRPCVLIASDKDFLKQCPDNTSFIEIPSKNAFETYDHICSKLNLWLQEQNHPRPLVLASCGPTAKAICLDYSSTAQVIDLGHGLRFASYGKKVWAWTPHAEDN